MSSAPPPSTDAAARALHLAPFAVLEHSLSVLTVKDDAGRYIYANHQARHQLGIKADYHGDFCDSDVFSAECASQSRERDRYALDHRTSVEYRAELELTNGTRFPARIVKSVLHNGDDCRLYVVTAIYNLSDLDAARQAALDAEQRLDSLMESAPYGILLVRMGKVVYANKEAASFFGCRAGESLLSRDYCDLLAPLAREAYLQREAAGGAPAVGFQERDFVRCDGSILQGEVFKRPVNFEGQAAVFVHLRDITERKRNEATLERLAKYDALTGLPNRHSIQQAAQRMLERSIERNEAAGLVFIDLDNFKHVNDTHGHATGDGLIRQVADRLAKVLRRADAIGRLGGDEFIVLLESSNKEGCERIVRRILEALREPFMVDGVELFSGASLGVATYPEAGQTVSELLQSADLAMYRAKNDGRFTYRFFEPEMNEEAQQNLWLDTNLRRAIVQQQFELYYQPKVSALDGSVVGMEALVRWNHPERGMVSPGEFIAHAEESGFIVQLGEWVIDAACAQLGAWRAEGLALPVAVNLSAKQLSRAGLVDYILACLDRHNVPAHLLELEITESALMHDEEVAGRMLETFRALGCKLYLDDFGTGYSSLSQLSRLAIDAFKIDRSFVQKTASEPKAAALVEAMAHIARALKLDMVAEGVETAAQLEALRRIGCTIVQGYMFARPMPAREVPRYLAKLDPQALMLTASAMRNQPSRAKRSTAPAGVEQPTPAG